MKTFTIYASKLSLALFAVLFLVFTIHAQTTTFTYHGQMTDGANSSPTGQYDLQFNLYDEVSGAHSPLNVTPIILEDVEVVTGLFSVLLDFGNLFDGGNRYLEIGVRPGSSTGAFTVLNPRQQITSSPYAIRSLSAATADTATNAQNLGGTASSNFVQTTDSRLTDARTPTAGSSNYLQNTSSLQSGTNFNIDGTGTANVFNATTQFNIGGTGVLSVAGTNNIFVGNSAGVANTTGSNNSFVGAKAGFNNTTGFSNLFIGYQVGFQNTSGSGNAFAGAKAGFSNQTGNSNSFFGPSAGFGNTTGFFNVFVGSQAGFSNTEGTNNSFVGTQAGFNNLTGNLNSFLGINTGFNNTTGSQNSLVGYQAGINNTTGSKNTIIGSSANVGANNLSYATALGAEATVSASNTVVLGRSAGQDTVQIPGNLNVSGTISGSISGASFTNLNASNITTGTLDNARLGVVPVNKGGTGLTAAGSSGNFLRSNGTGFTSSALQASDLPPLSTNYIQNQTTGPQFGGFNVSSNGTVGGTLSGNIVNATTQFNIGGVRALSLAGTDNTFGGSGAGNSNSIGTDNTFFGKDAGRSNTTGNNNSSFGSGAGFGLISGINNSFFGANAGNSNGGGSNNTFFGYNAGLSNTTGSHNTIIGASAGVGVNGLSFATAIGSYAQVNASDTIVIGKIAGNYPGFGFRLADTVIMRGWLQLEALATAGGNSLCWNNSKQVSLCSSSLRYKTNIAPFSLGLNLLQRLRPITFTWKDGGMKDLGFGAEDVAVVEPLLVTYNGKGEVEGVKYDRISAVLVNAVKEQQTQIETQQTQLKQQQAQIEAQQKQLKQQQSLIEGMRKLLCQQNPNADVCQ